MPRVNTYLQAFNVGVQDKKHLARVDLERMRLAAEIQTNLLPLPSAPAWNTSRPHTAMQLAG